jgi:signal peptidase I
VVGLPGDRIRMQGIQLFINDVPVPLIVTDRGELTGVVQAVEQLGEHSHAIQLDRRLQLKEIREEITVPADSYFVMGDSRNNSLDSWFFGTVHQDLVIGKVTRLLLSVADERDWLKAPRYGALLEAAPASAEVRSEASSCLLKHLLLPDSFALFP